MFKNLFDFKYKRSGGEAVGFYIAYFFLIIVIAGLAGGVLGLIAGQEDSFSFGVKVGAVVSIVSSLLLSFTILSRKKLLNNFGYIILALFSGWLAYFGGALLALIPVAFLSTRKSK